MGKLIKALPDPPLFTDGKDPSIDQWLSKMRGKFEINWDHYPSERSKLIYAENRVGGKALQHLEPCLRLNSITPFTTIDDLFNHLEDIFGNPHRKEQAMEKFRELKMGASSFSDFYSEFIRLASDLEYTSEMLIREFKHKLTPRLQDRLNSGIELPKTISALAKRCLSIYEQMQATDRIRAKAKSSTTVQTTAKVPLKAVTFSSRAPAIPNKNTSFSCLSNTLRGSITPTPRNSDAEISQLMKEGRCFNCKERGYTMLNCPKKANVSAITDASDIDNIENIDQGKE